MRQACENYRQFLEHLTEDRLSELSDYVSPQVHFQDPFNDVHSIEAMTAVFRHMFDTVGPVTFKIDQMAIDGNTCLMSWQFQGTLFSRPWIFPGTSVVSFGQDGKVASHIDHWDAARHFYERLPVIGWLVAWIRRRLAKD